MTRLFYGSTLLAGLCAMTSIVGCGGSSGPAVVTCDGGNCGDAKRDGVKLDVPPRLDGVQLDGPATKLDGPATTPDGPAPKLDGPATTPDGPAPTTDGPPPVIPDGPAPTTDGPPPVIPDGPAPTTDGPPPVIPDGPAPKLDGPPPDVTIPNPDARPPDTIIPPPTDAADAAADTTPVIHDAGPDGIVTVSDAAGDGGTDGIVAVVDAGPDGAVIIVDADAAAEAGPDGTVVVTGDAADGGVADAPEIDAPPVVDGAVSDGGGCSGDTCHAYTFEGDNPDAGMPTGFVTGAPASVWNVVTSGSDKLLRGVETAGTTEYIETTGGPWADQTIEVTMRFVAVTAANGVVRICGRANADESNAYCLYVTSGAGDAGVTSGSLTLVKRGGGALGASATANNLDIMVGTWHTYRLTISGSGTVQLAGYLDGDTTAKVTASDGPGGTYNSGQVALGVREVIADFDNLTVSSP